MLKRLLLKFKRRELSGKTI